MPPGPGPAGMMPESAGQATMVHAPVGPVDIMSESGYPAGMMPEGAAGPATATLAPVRPAEAPGEGSYPYGPAGMPDEPPASGGGGRTAHKHRGGFKIPRSPMFLAIYAVVLVVLVGGAGSFVLMDKSYKLTVDGQTREVSSFSGSVDGVLDSAGVQVGGKDVVQPAAGASLNDGDPIVVRHAHRLKMSVDGKPKTVWTTALTVDGALDQLSMADSAPLNASRAKSLPATGGFTLKVRTPRNLVILLDQVRLVTQTTATSVRGVLDEAGIKLGKHDKVNAKLGAEPRNGMVLRVKQLVTKPVTKSHKIEPKVKKKKDPNLEQGKKKVLRKGRYGIKTVVTAYVMERGHKKRKVIASTWKRHPRKRVIAIGTKPKPPAAGGGDSASGGGDTGPVPSGSPKAIAKQMLPQFGWDSSQFSCLDQLWNKESSWNVHAANPSGAYGIPQALPGSKMASAGSDWHDNAATQIKWGLGYIKDRYSTPCGAWSHSQAKNFY